MSTLTPHAPRRPALLLGALLLAACTAAAPAPQGAPPSTSPGASSRGAASRPAEEAPAAESPAAESPAAVAANAAQAPAAADAAERPYLEGAVRVAESLRRREAAADLGLAGGAAGEAVFFSELARLSRDDAFLNDARRDADRLLAALDGDRDGLDGLGLDGGLAGAAAALARVGEATGDERYLDGARAAIRLLREGSRSAGDGIEWETPPGIGTGSVGIGLTLLDLNRRLDRSAAPLSETWNLALATGRRLVETAQTVPGGLAWAPSASASVREGACGTVEAAYFLSHLYGASSENLFIDAALTGVRRLWEDGEETARELLSECPDPAAPARLSYRLYRITRDRVWLERAQGLATARLEAAATSCQAAEAMGFLLDLDRAERRREHRSAARQLAGDLLRTLEAGETLCGGEAGLDGGAAGAGLFLLRLDAAETGRRAPDPLPDQQL